MLGILSIVLFGASLSPIPLYAGDQKIVTDMCDKKVEVPVEPKRIACMHCVSPEKIMTLGGGSSILLMAEQSPWAYRLYPEIKKAKSNKGVTPEQLRDMNVDFVLYSPGMTKEAPFSTAGLKTICAFSAETRPRNLDEYRQNFERQISMFGDLLGPEAKARAEKYNAYFDRKVKEILSVTSKIEKKDRPRVYYGGLHGSPLGSQGNGSVMHWNTDVSGGNYLPAALDDNHATATLQQVRSWDPDIVLLSGYYDSSDDLKKNPDWASLKAVKNGKVYHLPRGIYTWDHASGEGVLLMIHMAKIFYPEQFQGWDMIQEMKTFYSQVYGKTVTDEDAERILNCLPPPRMEAAAAKTGDAILR
ncbi:iron complex transport system substrate-binding protein [Syntrophus gentianae]|uniref:Iron complex transport system substrate-binding protein n=1 Tax=Syntrophus gentianae TaxID=43775 RepID=A0A1H8ABP2_9BACT|nr:ABC transporter substrate-binding protein [Syntrophus gentianae]SEM67344.1 iron complex transport system substrate-binding protein [Syntrophus gentianae]